MPGCRQVPGLRSLPKSGDQLGGGDVTRPWTLRLGAGLAVVGVLLGGCSEKQEANETLPRFTVDIVAGATAFTWHTGDGTDLTTTDPGAPYPDQTVTHDYSSGTYTAYLTTTWGATFSIDGGASAQVPGTTTTDGPPVTFAVLQARPVLTNPYD
jgi:hypothetical protein